MQCTPYAARAPHAHRTRTVCTHRTHGQVVGAALANPAIGGSARCAAAVRAGVDALVAATRSGYGMHGDAAAGLPASLRPCSPLRSGVDVATYYASVFGAFQGAVQYNLQGRPPYVSDLCRAARDAGGAAAPLASLAAALALFDDASEIRRDDDGHAAPPAASPPAPPATAAAAVAAVTITAAATGTTAAVITVEETAAYRGVSTRPPPPPPPSPPPPPPPPPPPRKKACVPSSWQDDSIAPLTNITFSAAGCDLACTSDRQWVYQSCNEFGYFQVYFLTPTLTRTRTLHPNPNPNLN